MVKTMVETMVTGASITLKSSAPSAKVPEMKPNGNRSATDNAWMQGF